MNIEAYLTLVGTTPTLTRRVHSIEEFYSRLCPEALEEVCISEYVKEDGVREIESLWFFSRSYAMEASSFRLKDLFDITLMANAVDHLVIDKSNYEFDQATETSRLVATFTFIHGPQGVIKASAGNCEHLRDIILSRIMPNLIKAPMLNPSAERAVEHAASKAQLPSKKT